MEVALADNPPPTPSTYSSSHSRLRASPNSWLISLWNGGALPSRQNCDRVNLPYLLTSYLASKAAGDPNVASESKLFALAALDLDLGQVMGNHKMASVVGSHCTTTCSVMDTTVNFLTGDDDGTFAGEYLTVLAMCLVRNTGIAAHDVVIQRFSSCQLYPFPNGTGLNIIVLNKLKDSGEAASYQAIMCDWIYSDFTAQPRSNVRTSLTNLCLQFENYLVDSHYSPYTTSSAPMEGVLKEIRSS